MPRTRAANISLPPSLPPFNSLNIHPSLSHMFTLPTNSLPSCLSFPMHACLCSQPIFRITLPTPSQVAYFLPLRKVCFLSFLCLHQHLWQTLALSQSALFHETCSLPSFALTHLLQSNYLSPPPFPFSLTFLKLMHCAPSLHQPLCLPNPAHNSFPFTNQQLSSFPSHTPSPFLPSSSLFTLTNFTFSFFSTFPKCCEFLKK